MKLQNLSSLSHGRGLLGLAICQGLGALYAAPSLAQIIRPGSKATVGSLSDLPGDVNCSLRDAIQAVKDDTTVGGCIPTGSLLGDRVEFDPAIFPGTITLQPTTLVLDSAVSIQGPGPEQLTLSIGDAYRSVFSVEGAQVGLSGLKISESLDSCIKIDDAATLFISNATVADCQGSNGGGIHNLGQLNIDDSLLTQNRATSAGGAIYTGGIGSTVTLRNTDIISNDGGPMGGGLFGAGGDSELVVSGGTIQYNRAANGGGIYVSSSASASLTATTISANRAVAMNGAGGALRVFYGSASIASADFVDNYAYTSGAAVDIVASRATITESTFTGHSFGATFTASTGSLMQISRSSVYSNYSTFSTFRIADTSTLELENSTVSGNIGSTIGVNGYADITSSTITDNTTSSQRSAIDLMGTATLRASNNIVAGHDGYDCLASPGSTIPTNNNNVFNSGNCSENAVNLITEDPLLLPLADNGGPTLTHALQPGSPAIDAGDSSCTLVDQRNFVRNDGSCDIGAFEANSLGTDNIFDDGFE